VKVPRKYYGVFRRKGLNSVYAKRRTVAHFSDPDPSSKFGEIEEGDHFIAMGRCGQPAERGLLCHVVKVSLEPLLEMLTEEELIKLDCAGEGQLDEYFESWDEFHPDAKAVTNPVALRVEFEPTDTWIDIPLSPMQTIINTMARVAYAEIVAIEDARVFADLNQALEGSPP
jgi:hypothetical protein